MWVKICGTTTLADAQLAVEAGADAVGFVFAESARRVTPAQVAAITALLPQAVEKVGVFTEAGAEAVLQTAEAAGLTAVQLHGDYCPEQVAEIHRGAEGRLRILQVVSLDVQAEGDALEDFAAQMQRVAAEERVSAVLLDASLRGKSGGTGRVLPWERLVPILDRFRQAHDKPVILAGGLTPDNVASAIRVLAPWGVDVVSGVERAKGEKNPELVRAFLRMARTQAG